MEVEIQNRITFILFRLSSWLNNFYKMMSFFEKYQLIEQIGEESSYGVVFTAIDQRTNQKVAVKSFTKNRFAGENRKVSKMPFLTNSYI